MTDHDLKCRAARSAFHCTHSQRATRFDKLNDARSAPYMHDDRGRLCPRKARPPVGWTWRRSTPAGPMRGKFTNAAVGASPGARGAGVSVSPSGTYIHVGAGGFRYIKRLDRPTVDPRRTPPYNLSAASKTAPNDGARTAEVLEPAYLVDSTSDELLDEIRHKQKIASLVPVALSLSALSFLFFVISFFSNARPFVTWGTLSIGLLGLVVQPWATWHDRRARLVRLHYIFDPLGNNVHEGLTRLLVAFQRAHAIWVVHDEHHHGDWKRNAGAGTSVSRRRVHVGWGAPPFFETNARIGFVNIDGIRLYFFPDRLLVFGTVGVSSVRYEDLKLEANEVQFREEGIVPQDAKVIGTTWRYVNKGGGPDRRFTNNYQIPIVLYGTLDVCSPAGMELSLQTSAEGLAPSSVELLRSIQVAVRELESRRPPVAEPEAFPPFIDDPPPLFSSTKQAAAGLGGLLSFRWVERLPEWAKPIIWGVVFALPPVSVITWFEQGGAAATGFLCVAFAIAGVGIGILLHTRIRRKREDKVTNEASAKSRFRALLGNELKSRPLAEVNFRELSAATGIVRSEADRVADDMFRKVADRFAEDAVITEKEHDKLKKLAKALDMDPARANQIESEAKAARGLGAIAVSNADGSLPYSPADRRRVTGQRDSKAGSPPKTPSARSDRIQARSPHPAENDVAFDHAIGSISTPVVLDDDQPTLYTDDGLKPSKRKVTGERIPQRSAPAPPIEIEAKDVASGITLDNDSFDFQISPSSEAPPSLSPTRAEAHRYPAWLHSTDPTPKSPDLAWYGKGQIVHVGKYILRDPLVYTSGDASGISEASCINLRLPVGRPIDEPRGSLGYYPEYVRLSADQRANYLLWLAEGRSGPLDDIGYAFLYFYGLERRLLVEQQDLSPIVKEVVRLLETYTFSGSFDGYLSRFLSYSLAKDDIDTLKEKWFQAVFERTRAQRDEQHLAVGLAWFFKQRRPLPPAWAFRLARLDPRSPRSVVLDRLPDQFTTIFGKRYSEQFGDGLILRAAKRDREVAYRPASPSLVDVISARGGLQQVRVPNVMGIQSQFEPLVRIWSSCIEELKPLSRVIARGAEVTTREAYAALPDDLKSNTEHPDKVHWDKLSAEHAQEDGTVVVTVGSLAVIHGIGQRPRLTAKQCESLARVAHDVGFAIEPDVRVTNRPYGWEDFVALFRPEERPSLPIDGRYFGAALMLEIGMFVAAADGVIEKEEVDHIASFLESQFLLDPPDVRRLEALKQVFLRQHPSISGIGKRLKAALTTTQLESIGEFLVGVANSNGAIDKKEISSLRSAYRALGIDVKALDQLLDDYRRRSKEPIDVQSGTTSADEGEAMPSRTATAALTVFKLDVALLDRLMHETREVSSLLDDAMQEDESDGQPSPLQPAVPPPSQPYPRFDGLETRHSMLLTELCAHPFWPRADFDEVVRRYSLMPSGAIDTINEWSHDRFDDPILDEDGTRILVHIGLLSEGK